MYIVDDVRHYNNFHENVRKCNQMSYFVSTANNIVTPLLTQCPPTFHPQYVEPSGRAELSVTKKKLRVFI